MNSISLYATQPTRILEIHPWSRAQIGVRLRGGGLKFLPWGGFIPRDWLPSWATPVALGVSSWGVGPARGQDGNSRKIASGYIVGCIIEGRAWAVLYGGHPKEA